MADPLLEAQMLLALNYPLQTICFLFGGATTFLGLSLAILFDNGKWVTRGLYMFQCGPLIASPAIIPIVLVLINSDQPMPEWYELTLSYAYIVCPLAGFAGLIGMWYLTSKQYKVVAKGLDGLGKQAH